MRRVLKIIGLVIFAIILMIALFLLYISKLPSVPKKYFDKVKIENSPIEKKYINNGPFEVEFKVIKADEPIKEYRVYYPKNMSDKENLPLILSINGTGVVASKYTTWFEHMASYGFIVVGTEDPSTGKAESSDVTLDYLLKENMTEGSFLYKKIDTSNIGIVGHSQGGAGVFSATTKRKYKDLYKTVVALSPTHEETAHAFGWDYDLTSLKIPTLLLAGTTGDFETKSVIPIEKMVNMFNEIKGYKIMARRKEADHGKMLYSADGYVTAWFMWHLQGDVEAKKAFSGNNVEIINNSMYQDINIKGE